MRLNIPFYIPVIVLALSGVTFSSCHRSEPITEQAPVRVGVVVPRIVSDSDARTYSGIVESDQKSAVSFSVPGTISHIYVAEGQRVAKGQLLARVESGSLVNANNIAQATLAEARDAYERLKKLHDADALPEIKWVLRLCGIPVIQEMMWYYEISSYLLFILYNILLTLLTVFFFNRLLKGRLNA